jgi:hypothetical protein
MSGSSDELVIEGAVELMNQFLEKPGGSRDGWMAMIAWFELNHDFSDPQASNGFLKKGGTPWGDKRQPYREQSALALLMVLAPSDEKYDQLQLLGRRLCASYKKPARDATEEIMGYPDLDLVRELFLTMGLMKNCWAKRKHGDLDRLCGNKLLKKFGLSKETLPWDQAESATEHPKDYFDLAAVKMGIKKLGGSSVIEPADAAGAAAAGMPCDPSDRYNIIGVMDTSVQLFAEIRDAKVDAKKPNTTITVLSDWAWAHIDPSSGHGVSAKLAPHLPGVQNGSVVSTDLAWRIKVEYPRTIVIAIEESGNQNIKYRVGIYGGTDGALLKEEPYDFDTVGRPPKHPFSIGESIRRIQSAYDGMLFPKGKKPTCPVVDRKSAAGFLLNFHTKRLGDWNQGEAVNAVARPPEDVLTSIPASWAETEGFPTSSLNKNLLVRPDEEGCTIGPDSVADISNLLSNERAGVMFFTNDYLSGMEAAINGRSVSISQHGVALTTCLQRQEIIQGLSSSWTDWLSSVAKAIGDLLGITGAGASQGPPSADASQGQGVGSAGGGNGQQPSMSQRGGEPEDFDPLVLYTGSSICVLDLSDGSYYVKDDVDGITACQIMWAMMETENGDLVAYARHANQVLAHSRGHIDSVAYSKVGEETNGGQLRALLSEVLEVVADLIQPEYPLCPPGAQVVAGAQEIQELLSPAVNTQGELVASTDQTITIMDGINQIRLEFVSPTQDTTGPGTPDHGPYQGESSQGTQKRPRTVEASPEQVADSIMHDLACYGLFKLFEAPEEEGVDCSKIDPRKAANVAQRIAKQILDLRTAEYPTKLSDLSSYQLGLIVVVKPDELVGREDLSDVSPPEGYQALEKKPLSEIMGFIRARPGPSVGGSKKLRKGRSPRKSKKRKRKKTKSRKGTRKPRQGKGARKGTRKRRKKP